MFQNYHRILRRVLLSILVLLTISCEITASITNFDFSDYGHRITKHWDNQTADFVIKKYMYSIGEVPDNLDIIKLQGGASNNFIFLIKQNNVDKYILKGLIYTREALNLSDLQDNPIFNQLPNSYNAAKIVRSKLISQYQITGTNESKYFTILEAASGRELYKIMLDNLFGPQNKESKMQHLNTVFYTVGMQISQFHKDVVKPNNFITPKNLITLTHNDLHPENIFYDELNNKTTLIDNESMANRQVVNEVEGLYEIPLILWGHGNHKNLLTSADAKDLALIYSNLIKGLAAPYGNPREAQTIFAEKIIRMNQASINYLMKSPYEYWMGSPTEHWQHILVDGLIRVYSPESEIYVDKLKTINAHIKRQFNIN